MQKMPGLNQLLLDMRVSEDMFTRLTSEAQR